MVQEPKQIIKTLEAKIIRFIKHVMWHNKLITNIIERKINVKRGIG